MENLIKVQIVSALADYHAEGTKAIDAAYDIYSENGGTMSDTEFYAKLDIREIDDIDFMYDSDSEEWASDKEMITWYNRTIN